MIDCKDATGNGVQMQLTWILSPCVLPRRHIDQSGGKELNDSFCAALQVAIVRRNYEKLSVGAIVSKPLRIKQASLSPWVEFPGLCQSLPVLIQGLR